MFRLQKWLVKLFQIYILVMPKQEAIPILIITLVLIRSPMGTQILIGSHSKDIIHIHLNGARMFKLILILTQIFILILLNGKEILGMVKFKKYNLLQVLSGKDQVTINMESLLLLLMI